MKLLSLVVRASVILLAGSAVLVVLGLFNAFLRWDIFSPAVEKVLYGIFGSFLALAAIGAATCVVLGIQEMVVSVRRLVERTYPDEAAPAEAPRRSYAMALAGLLVLLVITVAGFGVANRRVTAHRVEVFKLIAQDQMRTLGPRLAEAVPQIDSTGKVCAPAAVLELFRTLNQLSFVGSLELYLPDRQDDAVLWKLASAALYQGDCLKMERFFIAKDDDRAVKLALQGDPAWINQKNGGSGFVWFHVVKDAQGHPLAILEIRGNPEESFREYSAGAAAQKSRAAGR